MSDTPCPPIVGFSSHRLQPNDLYYADEVALNKTFNDWIRNNPYFWDYMLGCDKDGMHPLGHLTPKELQIVATTIQWLGTPVGKSFLREAGILKDD